MTFYASPFYPYGANNLAQRTDSSAGFFVSTHSRLLYWDTLWQQLIVIFRLKTQRLKTFLTWTVLSEARPAGYAPETRCSTWSPLFSSVAKSLPIAVSTGIEPYGAYAVCVSSADRKQHIQTVRHGSDILHTLRYRRRTSVQYRSPSSTLPVVSSPEDRDKVGSCSLHSILLRSFSFQFCFSDCARQVFSHLKIKQIIYLNHFEFCLLEQLQSFETSENQLASNRVLARLFSK